MLIHLSIDLQYVNEEMCLGKLFLEGLRPLHCLQLEVNKYEYICSWVVMQAVGDARQRPLSNVPCPFEVHHNVPLPKLSSIWPLLVLFFAPVNVG